MKEIEQKLTTEVERLINENPYNNDGTVNVMLKRTEYVRDNAENVRVILNKISNEYVKENPDTDISDLTKMAQSLLDKYLTSFAN